MSINEEYLVSKLILFQSFPTLQALWESTTHSPTRGLPVQCHSLGSGRLFVTTSLRNRKRRACPWNSHFGGPSTSSQSWRDLGRAQRNQAGGVCLRSLTERQGCSSAGTWHGPRGASLGQGVGPGVRGRRVPSLENPLSVPPRQVPSNYFSSPDSWPNRSRKNTKGT